MIKIDAYLINLTGDSEIMNRTMYDAIRDGIFSRDNILEFAKFYSEWRFDNDKHLAWEKLIPEILGMTVTRYLLETVNGDLNMELEPAQEYIDRGLKINF